MAKAMTTTEQRAIAAAYVAGHPIEDIAKRFGRCNNTVFRLAKRLKLKPRRVRRVPRIPDAVIDWGKPRKQKGDLKNQE